MQVDWQKIVRKKIAQMSGTKMRLALLLLALVAHGGSYPPLDMREPVSSLWLDGVFQTIPSPAWPCDSDSFTQAARAANGSAAASVNTTMALCQHEQADLQLLRTIRRFSDFPGAVDVEATLQQAGSAATAHRVCDLAELDWRLPLQRGTFAVLRGHIGGNDSAIDFSPVSIVLGNNTTNGSAQAHASFTSVGGLPSGAHMPVFSLSLPGAGAGGFVWSLGWSGNWMQTFSVSGDTLRIRIASGVSSSTGARFCPVMRPGESFPLARVLLLPWATATEEHNVLRQFLRRHVVPLDTDGRPAGLLLSANDFDRFNGRRDARTNLWLASEAARSGLDALWVDAEWFSPAFPFVGSWRLPLRLVEDRKSFPAGLRPVFDAAKQQDLKSILWTEPERVVAICKSRSGSDCAYIAKEFPSWILHANASVERSRRNHESALLNLGNPDARRYITEFLSTAVEQYRLDVLRFDFNVEPAQYWIANDEPNRSGVTERLYLQGLATMWDELRARHPGLLLDSCASGGRRLDLNVLSRAVVLARSDYEFGSSHVGKCTLPAHEQGTMPLYLNHTVDYEASQSMTMGSFLHNAIPFGAPVRHFCPYATRSAGPAAKAVDWGLADWSAVAANGSEFHMVKQAMAEARLLREFILDANEYFPLLGADAGAATNVWAAYQLHRPDRDDGYAMFFRRCDARAANVSVQLRSLRPSSLYTLSFRFGYVEDLGRRRTARGSALMSVLSVELPPMESLLLVYWRRDLTS